MYSIGIAAQLLGVCRKTLRRLDQSNKIRCLRTAGGHHRFPINEIQRFVGRQPGKSSPVKKPLVPSEKSACCAIYARVSFHKQKKDLQRQIKTLEQYLHTTDFTKTKAYQDIGSRLNTNRKGLWKLLKDARRGNFFHVMINYRDRVTRFGFRYLERYLQEFGMQIHTLHYDEDGTPQSELLENMIVIIHSFSGKLYRMRRTSKKTSKG
ncbi:MAG: IS607 family transposase [Promethearchaeia archaeon]